LSGRKVLAVNFKVYEQAFTRFKEIASAAERARSRFNSVRVILVVPSPIVYGIAGYYDDVYLQHVDMVDYGAHTGFIPARALEHLPVRGVMLNHSEHKVTLRHLQKAVGVAKEVGNEVLLCADTPKEAAALSLLEPSYIAVEPPELIGTGISVSRAKPEVITGAVEAVQKVMPGVPVLAGAGISGEVDAVKSLEYGAVGVLVASYIMKADDPGGRLLRMAEAMDSFTR
jgi:triosephosphate isomerase